MNKYKEHSKAGKANRDMRKKVYSKGFASCAKKRSFGYKDEAERFLHRTGHEGQP